MCHYDYDDEVGYGEKIECCECRDLSDRMYTVEQGLRRVIHQIYGQHTMDVSLLDDAIEEICNAVGFDMPFNMPRVKRSGSEIFEFADSVNQ